MPIWEKKLPAAPYEQQPLVTNFFSPPPETLKSSNPTAA